MKPKNQIPSFEHPSYQSQDELWELTLGLDLPSGARFTRDQHGNPAIHLDSSVPYPHIADLTAEGVAKEILLSQSSPETPDTYTMPENSTTLTTILNEAAGTTDSFEVAPEESRTLSLLSGLLHVLTSDLRRLVKVDKVLPAELIYKQVLVMKDVLGYKILPPLILVPITDNAELREGWDRVKDSFVTSLSAGANSPSQWRLVGSLQEPIREAFLWERLSYEK